MLKLKSYIGNKRRLENTAESIKIKEEYQEIEAGWWIALGEDSKHRHSKKGWIDKVNDKSWRRNMKLESSEVRQKQIKNKALIEYALEHVEFKRKN